MILTRLMFDNFTQQTYFQTSIPLLVLLLDAWCDHNKLTTFLSSCCGPSGELAHLNVTAFNNVKSSKNDISTGIDYYDNK